MLSRCIEPFQDRANNFQHPDLHSLTEVVSKAQDIDTIPWAVRALLVLLSHQPLQPLSREAHFFSQEIGQVIHQVIILKLLFCEESNPSHSSY